MPGPVLHLRFWGDLSIRKACRTTNQLGRASKLPCGCVFFAGTPVWWWNTKRRTDAHFEGFPWNRHPCPNLGHLSRSRRRVKKGRELPTPKLTRQNTKALEVFGTLLSRLPWNPEGPFQRKVVQDPETSGSMLDRRVSLFNVCRRW